MPETSWPSPNYAAGAVNETEYEKLVAQAATSGLIGDPTLTAIVYGDSSGRLVKVRADRYGLVRGRLWTSGSAELSITIAANATSYTRIDRLVLRYNRSTFDVRLAVVQGAAAATPAVPALTNNEGLTGVWELPIAQITVPAGAAVITAGNVKIDGWYLSEDGGVVCTSTSRPPVALVGAGVHMTETDTGSSYMSTRVAWLLIGEDSGDAALTFYTGWANSLTKIRRRNGLVVLNLSFRRAAANLAASTTVNICTVPIGFRPAYEIRANGSVFNTALRATDVWLRILPSGLIYTTDFTTIWENGDYAVCTPIVYFAA